MQRVRHHLGAGSLAMVALLGLLPAGSQALVLHEGSSGPAVRPPDTAIGRWSGNASCVAVGPDMILTTRHQFSGVGAPVVFGDTDYQVAEIFAHHEADLRLARVVPTEGGVADLTPVDLYTTSPHAPWIDEIDYEAVIGGYGKARGDDLYSGDIHYGYTWADSTNTVLRWGENDVESLGTAHDSKNGFTTEVIVADFDLAGGLGAEAAPADYDSGGGWFVDVSIVGPPDWRLAGLTRGVTRIGESWFRQKDGGPPGDTLDAVRTSVYAAWIDAVLHPHQWVTDADGNWFDPANWSTTVPDAAERWAVFGDVISGPRTVTLDEQVVIGTLRIDAGEAYCFTDGLDDPHWLVFDSDEDVAAIEVNRENKTAYNAAHRIEATIWLRNPIVVNQCSSGELTLAGVLAGNGSITKRGDGVLVLDADNHTTLSSDLIVEEGVLCAADPGALGTGDVLLRGGDLHLRADDDALFPNRVEATADAALRVEPDAGGTGARLAVGEFKSVGGLTFTISGSGGYGLAVAGETRFTLGAGSVCTLETATADLTLEGTVRVMGGTLRKTGPGALTFASDDPADMDFWEETALQVEDGTVRFHADAGAADRRNLAVQVDGSGAVEFTSTQHLAEVHLADGAVTCLPHGDHTLVTGDLQIDETGGVPDALLDLADNNLVVDYASASPFDVIETWVADGLASGATCGIASATALTDGRPTALAVVDNTDPLAHLTTLEGEPLTDPADPDYTQVLVRFTWYGDVNLDGIVDAADYSIIDESWNNGSPTPAGGGQWRWACGDINRDDSVDAADYALIDHVWSNFQGQTLGDPPAAEEPVPATASEPIDPAALGEAPLVLVPAGCVVPEPATLALAAAGAMAVLARRRAAARRRSA